MSHTNGVVFSIEEFSIYDGPGIRTTVFLKGCPLRCSWCHNPEGQETAPQIVKSPNGCTSCGACRAHAVPGEACLLYTQKSIESCPHQLLRVCGASMSAEALTERLLKNRHLLQEGGVTFSGGEPLMQGAFVKECLSLLKGRLHTAIQTSGYGDSRLFEELLALADLFLFDIKLADDAMHKRYTGVSNKSIRDNLDRLVRSGKEWLPRIPLIPTVTDTVENITQIAALLRENGVTYAELMSYNKMAGGKYALVGKSYTPDFDELVEVQERREIFDRFGIKTKVL